MKQERMNLVGFPLSFFFVLFLHCFANFTSRGSFAYARNAWPDLLCCELSQTANSNAICNWSCLEVMTFWPRRCRLLFVLKLSLFALTIFSMITTILWSSQPTGLENWILGYREKFTYRSSGLSYCPVCFGIDSLICHVLLGGEISVAISAPWTKESTKGVSYGTWRNEKVVIKRLGTKAEIIAMDKHICESAGKKSDCNLERDVWNSDLIYVGLDLNTALNKYFDCPSQRFIQKVKFLYGKTVPGSLTGVEAVHLFTGLHLNPELLLLQVFRQEEGWPFPKFFGVCGRVMVAENVGASLEDVLDKPWEVRAKIALKLVNLAHLLTSGLDDWAIYIGDASMENFGVSSDGEVKLLDLEHLVVVDLKETRFLYQGAPYSEDLCVPNKPDCLSCSPSDLCSGQSKDHNYYAICRGVLKDFKTRRGLLHSPSDFIAKTLSQLIDKCVSGKGEEKRVDIVGKLTNLLKKALG